VSATQTSRRDWTAVIFVAMALGGAVLQLRGAVLPTLQRTFGTPEWQLGLVAPAGMVGYVAAVLLTGFATSRRGDCSRAGCSAAAWPSSSWASRLPSPSSRWPSPSRER
jgi:MFS family permease